MKIMKKAAALGCAAILGACAFALPACGSEVEVEAFIKEAYAASAGMEIHGADISFSGNVSYQVDQVSLSVPLSGEAVLDIDNAEADISLTSGYGLSSAYSYMYLRDNFLFSTDTLEYPATPDEMIFYPEYVGADAQMPDVSITPVPENVDLSFIFAVASVANAYNAASATQNSVTLNLITLLEGIYDDVAEIIQNFTAETTISDIYSSDLVRTIVHATGKLLTPDEVYQAMNSLLSNVFELGTVNLPVPEEDEELYDYIASVLADAAFAQSAGLTGSIGDQKLLPLIQTATGSQVTAEQIKEGFASLSESVNFDGGLNIIVPNQCAINVSRANISYLFDNKALSGCMASISATIDVPEMIMGLDLSVQLSYSQSAPQLTDISAGQVFNGTDLVSVSDFIAANTLPAA